MVFFHIWGLNSCHLKVPHKLMLGLVTVALHHHGGNAFYTNKIYIYSFYTAHHSLEQVGITLCFPIFH